MSELPKYAAIIPCAGWAYVHPDGEGKEVSHDVAVWAMLETGEVIGLISVQNSVTEFNVSKLIAPPPIGGKYVRR